MTFRARALLPWLAMIACATDVQAGKIYKYVDARGITHYTDRKPDAEVDAQVIAVRAELQPIATMRLDGSQQQRQAVVFNRLAGPVEVEIRFRSDHNIAATPALPLRVVIPAQGEQRVLSLQSIDPEQPASFKLEFSAIPGDPAGRNEAESYLLPLDSSVWRIDQGFGGSFSHTGASARYAIDLAAEEGTPVVAARDGVVMQVEDDFEGAGLDLEKFGPRANLVRVLHSDGSMAVYAHLSPDSVMLRAGARVRAGQRLGLSGNTGYSTGPHLHFAVQLNRGMALESVPFRLHGPDGPIAISAAPVR